MEKKTMNEEVFKKLGPGDIVRHKSGGNAYIVTANYGNRITAVRTADLTNPNEWSLVSKVSHKLSRIVK